MSSCFDLVLEFRSMRLLLPVSKLLIAQRMPMSAVSLQESVMETFDFWICVDVVVPLAEIL